MNLCIGGKEGESSRVYRLYGCMVLCACDWCCKHVVGMLIVVYVWGCVVGVCVPVVGVYVAGVVVRS